MLVRWREMYGRPSLASNIDNSCFLDFSHHARREVFDLLASVVLGFGARAVDLRPFEQMEQQGYGPCAPQTQDLDNLELRRVLDK